MRQCSIPFSFKKIGEGVISNPAVTAVGDSPARPASRLGPQRVQKTTYERSLPTGLMPLTTTLLATFVISKLKSCVHKLAKCIYCNIIQLQKFRQRPQTAEFGILWPHTVPLRFPCVKIACHLALFSNIVIYLFIFNDGK